MRVLFPAAVIVHCRQLIVLVPVHWFMARKSCIFKEDDVKLALSTKNNNFSLPPPLTTTFLLFSHHHIFIVFLHQHHNHISVVFPPPPPHFHRFPSTTNRLVHLKIAHDLILTTKPPHFNHEIKTKRYDIIGVHEFLPSLMRFLPKKRPNWSLLHYCCVVKNQSEDWFLRRKSHHQAPRQRDAIAIKQKKPSLNRDEGEIPLGIRNNLFNT